MKVKVKLNRKQLIIIIPLIVIALTLIISAVSFTKSVPTMNPAKLESDKTTKVYDSAGNVIAELHAEQNRVPVTLNKMSNHLKNAVIATEDVRFYDHHGVDLKAILRAAMVNVSHHETSEGGSTITQQLVKNSFLTPKRTMKRKLQEAYMAINLERKYTKEEILELYLNKIYFGHGAYGVETAAQVYFGKKASELNLGESAMLAGLPRNPGSYSPYINMQKAKERQAIVLDQMVKAGYISESDARIVKDEPLKLVGLKNQETTKYLDFIDCVIEEAENKFGLTANQIYKGGINIYTTLDPLKQNIADEIYANDNNFPAGQPDQIIQSGMVLLDPHNGEIIAMVGGRKQSVLRGHNRAIDPVGQPGSTFKPIAVYGPALENQVSPDTVLIDQPVSFTTNGVTYSPKNSDYSYRGAITMRQAVAGSVNVYAVKMLNKIGVDKGYEFARKLGFKQLGKNDRGLSLALGGTSQRVSPLQMATAFGAFDNKGVLVESHSIIKITDYKGKELYVDNAKRTQIMSETTAKVMTELLEGVVKYGTGTRARLNRPAAGKTGTTELPFMGVSGNQDTWFVGYTPELVAAVWVGYDKTDSTHYMTSYGGNYPAMIWNQLMSKVLAGAPVKDFERNTNYSGFKQKFTERVPAPLPQPAPTPPPTPVPESTNVGGENDGG